VNNERVSHIDTSAHLSLTAADENSLNARAQWVRQYLRGRPEKNIVLVAHGDILRRITASQSGNSTYQWKNAEVRLYNFDPDFVDKDACFLKQISDIAAAGGYEQTSTEMEFNQQAKH
jgi:broad specificity phosphatase PhoE